MPEWARAAEARLLTGRTAPTDRFWVDPARVMADAGMPPDPWQAKLLRAAPRRTLLLCSRQAGKSQTAAALALHAALCEAPALVLLLSPTLRQSGELFRDKVVRLYDALGRPVPTTQESALTMSLANGSRIVSLPGEEATIRGYSGVALLVIDEAARVSDDLYRAARPVLAVSGGRLVALSSAYYANQGWFYKEWTGARAWERIKITADQCPRIPADFLEEERAALGERWYAMEYECDFLAAGGVLFRSSWWKRYRVGGDHYLLADTGETVYQRHCRRIVVMDPAGGVGLGADFTCIGVFEFDPRQRIFVVHIFRGRIPWEEIPKKLLAICKTWQPLYVVVEGGFLQSALVRVCRGLPGMPAIKEVRSSKNKLARATPAIVRAEAGQVVLPLDAPWGNAFEAELESFTGEADVHDDQVDVLAWAALELQDSDLSGAEPFGLGR
jgi:predicted phage terminase large subunit-like protein